MTPRQLPLHIQWQTTQNQRRSWISACKTFKRLGFVPESVLGYGLDCVLIRPPDYASTIQTAFSMFSKNYELHLLGKIRSLFYSVEVRHVTDVWKSKMFLLKNDSLSSLNAEFWNFHVSAANKEENVPSLTEEVGHWWGLISLDAAVRKTKVLETVSWVQFLYETRGMYAWYGCINI